MAINPVSRTLLIFDSVIVTQAHCRLRTPPFRRDPLRPFDTHDLAHITAPTKPLREAIIEASVSRLRPVMLAAVTTILGMIPLLWDAFFVSMAVTIMGGLAFATVLTLVAAPVFYLIFFARDEKREKQAALAA